MESAFFICYLSSSLITDREFLITCFFSGIDKLACLYFSMFYMSEVHVSFLFALNQ